MAIARGKRRRPAARLLAAAFLLALALAACGQTQRNADPPPAPAPAHAQADVPRAFVIVLENHAYGQVIGNPDAPYLNRLAHQGALATNYYAVAHPSLPNYLALTGGSTFGIHSDCLGCSASGPNLATQLSAAGISWRAYMGGMPKACYGGNDGGVYARRHNPFVYFPAVASHPALCRHDVPAWRLRRDIAAGHLPRFGWLTPNGCQDGHDCPIAHTDQYLSQFVPSLVRALGPRGYLAITFDEGTTDAGCCGDSAGGRVATILAGGRVRGGARITAPRDHYSLLRTIENTFSLPPIRAAAGAASLEGALNPS
jgi:phosphatidylinositol-3-phosphatase